METLAQNIKFDEEFVVYLSGSQMGMNGSNYIILQYRYKSDTNTPPLELIKVIFDEKDKIAGIQPTKRL